LNARMEKHIGQNIYGKTVGGGSKFLCLMLTEVNIHVQKENKLKAGKVSE